MTTNETLTPEQRDYLEAFVDELQTFLRGRSTFRGLDTGDVIGFAAQALLTNLSEKMKRYPDPRRYARQRLANAAEDYRRREWADAGMGARATRKRVAGDTAHHEWDGVAKRETCDIGGLIVEREALKSALAKLNLQQYRIVCLVDIQGHSVAKASQLLGCARETASRLRSAALKVLRSELARATGPAA